MRKFLQEHFLFKNLSPQQIDRLDSCIARRVANRGATIFAKGDPGSRMFTICKGVVKIGVASVDGHDAVFNLLGRGDIFGEIAILDGGPRSADAVAATDCELLVIEGRDFLPILRTEPELSLKVIEVLCARLRRSSAQAENLMFRRLPSRLALALLQLADSGMGERKPKVAVTQGDLANMIGMSRESTNKQLRKWKANNWVRLERGRIFVTCFERLISIAEADGEAMRGLQSRAGTNHKSFNVPQPIGYLKPRGLNLVQRHV
jgi:CRP/FNR family cyclic AMP-dependent transcriptional regulator